MTPREKAKELVDKFSLYSYYTDEDCCLTEEETMIKNAKAIAIIAVDEIINSVIIKDLTTAENQFNYWEEVKQEIEKL